MLNCNQEIRQKIAAGNLWIVYDEVNVLDAFESRTKARAAKGSNKVKQWEDSDFNADDPSNATDDSNADYENGGIQGVINGAEAAGLNVVVIDENTDFSKLDMAPPAGHVPARGPSEADFQDTEGDAFVADMTAEQSEFAKDKEAMTTDPKPTPTPIDPVKEVKVKPPVSHKSTVEKPTKLVHAIADMMADANPDVTRKEIIAACTEAGIAYYTILTQYQAWKAARG
jgi:hypothetical protein